MVFLGIDGGGSKTAFVLEDDSGNELGRVETGPSNWMSAGKDVAYRNISSGITQLKTTPHVVCGGFAGAGRPEGLQFYRECLTTLLPGTPVFIETDAFISYIGAIGLEPGILLIAGTGSIAIGRRKDGTMIRVGGWGPTFSDEGSGFWIGREAIRDALRASDSGKSREYVASLCEALHIESIHDVSAAWKSGALTVQAVASLASMLFRQYPSEPAKRILNDAAIQLRTIAETAIDQVGIPDCQRAIAGSIGCQPMMRELMRRPPNGMEFEDSANGPERGAIIWARLQVKR